MSEYLYQESAPGIWLDLILIGGISGLVKGNMVGTTCRYALQATAAVAAGHLTGQYGDFRRRCVRREMSMTIIRRDLTSLKKNVSSRDAIIYMYGTLAFALQRVAARHGIATKKKPGTKLLSLKDIGRQIKFLRSLCETVDPDKARFDPFPRNLKHPRDGIVACVFLFEQWQKTFKKFSDANFIVTSVLGEEYRSMREAIRSLAGHPVWFQTTKDKGVDGGDVLASQLCLLYLAIMDTLLDSPTMIATALEPVTSKAKELMHTVRNVISMVRGEDVASAYYTGPALGYAGFDQKLKRSLRVLKHLLQLAKTAAGRLDDNLLHKDGYYENNDLDNTANRLNMEQHEQLLMEIFFGKGSATDSVSSSSSSCGGSVAVNAQTSADEHFLATYWKARSKLCHDKLMRRVWKAPLPDAPMVVRNWSPCMIGCRIYRLGESPLDKRSSAWYHKGGIIPGLMQEIMEPIPITQTRLKSMSEWVFRPKISTAVKSGGFQKRKNGSESQMEYVSTSWDPLRIQEEDVEFELIIFSIDGVVLDEHIIARGEVYNFDIERPPKPQLGMEQYCPPSPRSRNPLRKSVIASYPSRPTATCGNGDFGEADPEKNKVDVSGMLDVQISGDRIQKGKDPTSYSGSSIHTFHYYDDSQVGEDVEDIGENADGVPTKKSSKQSTQKESISEDVGDCGLTQQSGQASHGETSDDIPMREVIANESVTLNFEMETYQEGVSVVNKRPKIHARRVARLTPDEMLEKLPNLPDHTLCPKCIRRMDRCYGCKPREIGDGYPEGVDCDSCGRQRIDVNPAWLLRNAFGGVKIHEDLNVVGNGNKSNKAHSGRHLNDSSNSDDDTETSIEEQKGNPRSNKAKGPLDQGKGGYALTATGGELPFVEDDADEWWAAMWNPTDAENYQDLSYYQDPNGSGLYDIIDWGETEDNAGAAISEGSIKKSRLKTSKRSRRNLDDSVDDDDSINEDNDSDVSFKREDNIIYAGINSATEEVTGIVQKALGIGRDFKDEYYWHGDENDEERPEHGITDLLTAAAKQTIGTAIFGKENPIKKHRPKAFIPTRPEQENVQPFYHCPRCQYDLCKPCALKDLRESWWTT